MRRGAGEVHTVGTESYGVHGQVETHGEALELHSGGAEQRHHAVLCGRGKQVSRGARGERRLGRGATINLSYTSREGEAGTAVTGPLQHARP